MKDIDFIRLNLEIESGVNLICFGYEDFTNRKSNAFIHRMNDFTLQFVEFGEGQYFINDNTYLLKPHDLFYLPYNKPLMYVKNPQNPYKYYWISFQGNGVENFLKSTVISDKFPIIHIEKWQEMLSLFKELNPASPPTVYKIKAVFYSIFSMLQKQGSFYPSTADKSDLLVSEIKKYITINFSQTEFSVKQVAEQFYLNPSTLYRLFIKETGISVKEFIINTRLENAKNLLESGSLITYAAYQSGFSDIYYFSKFFKKRYGITPSQFKNIPPDNN